MGWPIRPLLPRFAPLTVTPMLSLCDRRNCKYVCSSAEVLIPPSLLSL